MPVIVLSEGQARELNKLTVLELSALAFWNRIMPVCESHMFPVVSRLSKNTYLITPVRRETNAPRPSAELQYDEPGTDREPSGRRKNAKAASLARVPRRTEPEVRARANYLTAEDNAAIRASREGDRKVRRTG